MDLKTLLSPLENYRITGSLYVAVSGICYDSRKAQLGSLFVALPGIHFHGSQFWPDARKAGAVAILTDRVVEGPDPCIVVENPRLALAKITNHFYDYPSRRLKLHGVTGTNGKTTTTFLLRSILEASGTKCGIIGTIRYSGDSFSTLSRMTTPESLDLQEILTKLLSEGSGACSMEVSSHALVQYRVAGCAFQAAVFTNLTQDHLDYHGTMEEYFRAKQMLFDENSCITEHAVINYDDPYGRRLLELRRVLNRPAASYGFTSDSDFFVRQWSSTMEGSRIVIHHAGKDYELKSPLIGKYNIYNISGAFGAAFLSGVDPAAIAEGIERMTAVPGRLERLDYGQPFIIISDYAHTEDAFRQLLPTLRPCTKKRLIIIFGCGGERDHGKRPLMGRAAGELADVIFLTSDNPRSENPLEIIGDVRAGIDQSGNKNLHIVVDRADAIAAAVKIAEPGDTIVITGKGNETYQLIQGQRFHFDDREVFQAAINNEDIARFRLKYT